ncbi:VRR-NUC domain-containing protein [Rhodoferax aquaticus]|uniref:VRR-NUC domain-containing protein n=1 Tax=Rhodoferax aquaticus TaxID=2527691 RepID=A0A515EMR0_9BURK|nr:VRR-NUC domain-containing protein [Rhodoferax aquaticus]QDL53946.1 VRR-NUC domain-containing protein [Rhodoferax aquaticus]
MIQTSYSPAGNSCTTLEERKEYAKLTVPGKGYLTEKAETALSTAKVLHVKTKNGNIVERVLCQLTMSGAIRVEEALHNYLWQYKAEVSFDMTPTRVAGGVPKPFLSNCNKHDPLRRHSLNPFPPGLTSGMLRRPDVIITKSEALRWPGRATTDHQGVAHPDNLLRVVELKFPGDSFDRGQRDAYMQIAGESDGKPVERLCLVDVNDCEGELERVRDRVRAPIRTKVPVPEKAFYERWLIDAEHAAETVWADMQAGVRQLSSEAQTWLRREAPWLFVAGRWVRDTTGQVYRWVTQEGAVIAQWTVVQLKAAWAQIAAATDLVSSQIQRIDWTQVLIDTVKGICVIGMLVAGVMIAVTLAPALAAALIAIVGIFGGAATA